MNKYVPSVLQGKHAQTCAHTETHTCTHTHTSIHTYKHTRVHINTHMPNTHTSNLRHYINWMILSISYHYLNIDKHRKHWQHCLVYNSSVSYCVKSISCLRPLSGWGVNLALSAPSSPLVASCRGQMAQTADLLLSPFSTPLQVPSFPKNTSIWTIQMGGAGTHQPDPVTHHTNPSPSQTLLWLGGWLKARHGSWGIHPTHVHTCTHSYICYILAEWAQSHKWANTDGRTHAQTIM